MEPKKFQKKVIGQLTQFLNLLNETNDIKLAYNKYWNEQDIPVGTSGVRPYQNNIKNTPHICFKVPTGGGKTFLACNSIKPIFDAMPFTKTKAVVWLVPSNSILEQTINNLKDVSHPYRQKIDIDFNSRVEIYTKEQLLNGNNFNPTSVNEQLSIFVLSYDTFRSRKKEDRKIYQENGNLSQFTKIYNSPELLIDGIDDTALIQVINQLSPVIIVDESHNATTDLSIEMLNNLNPSFILDLTATPKENSNIISYIDAIELKNENMVKLPVIVYNRPQKRDVIIDSIDLRNKLEVQAMEEFSKTKKYIRPIVLFQAQPKGKENNETFEKLKEELINIGIPQEEIAIKTSEINELKGIDLLSQDCPIRYIITVNALKEGWDCPFAYILATLANKSSRVEVEQILGRILRQPYAKLHNNSFLNMSYVLTSSANFRDTLENIVVGLNKSGFSKNDYRVGINVEIDGDANSIEQTNTYNNSNGQETSKLVDKSNGNSNENQEESNVDSRESQTNVESNNIQNIPLNDNENDLIETTESNIDLDQGSNLNLTLNPNNEEKNSKENEEFLDVDFNEVKSLLEERNNNTSLGTEIEGMLNSALVENEEYSKSVEEVLNNDDIPQSGEIRDKMKFFKINEECRNEVENLRIPQFFIKSEPSLFSEAELVLLNKERLAEDFSLKNKDTAIDFDTLENDLMKVDINKSGEAVPKYSKLTRDDANYFKEYFSNKPHESKIKECKDIIYRQIKKIDTVDDKELRSYVDRVVDNMKKDQIENLESSLYSYVQKIKKKILALQDEYLEEQFDKLIEQGIIFCEDSYVFKKEISLIKTISTLPKTLYEEEGNINNFEHKVINEIISMDNVKWWHRNIDRKGLNINGFVNHYPDFIVMTNSGKVLLIETKGDHLENTESRQKVKLGRTWQHQVGSKYRYYMVFESKDLKIEGAYQYDKFIEIVKNL